MKKSQEKRPSVGLNLTNFGPRYEKIGKKLHTGSTRTFVTDCQTYRAVLS